MNRHGEHEALREIEREIENAERADAVRDAVILRAIIAIGRITFARFDNVDEQLDRIELAQAAITERLNNMPTLEEARDAILSAVADAKATMERAEAAILSAITDLQAGASTQAVADALSAAATDLNTGSAGLGTAADSLSAADPTP